MVERFLYSVALFCRRRYRLVFLLAGAVAAICLVLTLRLEFESDMLAVLPRNEPRIDTFRETLEEFGGLDLLLVVVGIPELAATDPYLIFAAELGERLAALEELEYVDYRIGEREELVAAYIPSAFFLLGEEERQTFESKLSDEGIRTRVAELRRQLSTPQSLAVKKLMKLDPLGLSEAFVDQLTASRGVVRVDFSTGFFLSADRRLLLLLAKPVKPAQDVAFTRQLIGRVDEVISEALASWKGAPDGSPLPAPTVRLGGNYVTVIADESYIRRDIVTNAVTSMVGVLLLFLIAFRRLGLLLYAFVPLSMGLLLTYGFAAVTVGSLNAASAAFAALLVGLGVDFVIVSYGRYVEERRAGKPLREALGTMSGYCGRAVFVGAVTSAATFYAFTFTEFIGLREMGLLTGTGILLCGMSVLFLLPAMLAWSEDHHSRKQQSTRLVLHGFGIPRVVRFCMKRPIWVLASGAAVTLVLGVSALGLRFEDSIREMRPEGGMGREVEKEVAERFGSGFDFMMLVLTGETLEEALELTDHAVREVEKIVGGGEIARFDSIASILPSRSRQEETLAWLRNGREGLLDSNRIRATFESAVRAEGMRLGPFVEGLDLFEQAVSVDEPMSLRDLSLDDSSRRLLERFVRETDSGWKSIVYLYPVPSVWKRQAPPSALRLEAELAPEAVLSGVNVVSAFLRQTIKRDALIATVIGFIVVTLLLWLDLRRPLDTILCMAPLTIGILWMLGAMTLLGLPMNFFNIFVTTMIIGIGVDYGIHMMHRYREARDAQIERLQGGLEETGKAVVLAALSTMVGFGSLSLSSYPGIRSMGVVAIMGAFATAFVAITLLPAYLSLRLQRISASNGLRATSERQ